MGKYFLGFLLFSLCISGCTYNISRHDYESSAEYYARVNHFLANTDSCLINFKNHENDYGYQSKIINDTLRFYDLKNKKMKVISMDNIVEIKYLGTGSSVFEGFLFGGIAGGVFGNILSKPSKPGIEKGFSVILGVLIGGTLGIIYSLVSPPSTVISF